MQWSPRNRGVDEDEDEEDNEPVGGGEDNGGRRSANSLRGQRADSRGQTGDENDSKLSRHDEYVG